MMLNKILIFIVLCGLWSCSKVQDVSSVRLIGSNTGFNALSKTTDGQTVLLRKKQFYMLTDPSTLKYTDYIGSDSVEIEKVLGSSDTLLLQTAKGLGVYYKSQKKYNELNDYGFKICDNIAKVDSFVVWASGANVCNPSKIATLTLLYLNKKSELVKLSEIGATSCIDLAVYKGKVLALNNLGAIEIYEIQNSNLLVKLKDNIGLQATSFRVFPEVSKILVTTPTGVVQYKIESDFSLSKVNQINKGTI